MDVPRANRYIQGGTLYHLTHRCHDRRFLFQFGVVRSEYRKRLRLELKRFDVRLLAYNITSNHTHLLVEPASAESLSRMMQKLEGEFAQWYNLSRKRGGAFWTDRFHCTMVEAGSYAWNCMVYIDMNMVRTGVVSHPSEWTWCSYPELTGRRKRYRLLDTDCVSKWLGGLSREAFIPAYEEAVRLAIVRQELERNPIWTDSIAVGSQNFVEAIFERVRGRHRLLKEEVSEGCWRVCEPESSYNPFFSPKIASKARLGPA